MIRSRELRVPRRIPIPHRSKTKGTLHPAKVEHAFASALEEASMRCMIARFTAGLASASPTVATVLHRSACRAALSMFTFPMGEGLTLVQYACPSRGKGLHNI